jgi:hypothetical protein
METEAAPATHELTDDDPPFEFTVHRNALLELAAFLVAAAAIDMWLLQPGILASLKPHPFWIPIVLISLQYGTIDGLVAVAACTMTLWLLDWPKPDANEEYFIYLSRILTEPMLWLGSAILIGEFRLRQFSEARRLKASRDRIDNERTLLAAHLTDTYRRVERLELQLSGTRPDSSAELLEALSMLHRSKPHDAYFKRAIEVCAEIALGADSLSLYELVDGALVATLRIGPDAIPIRRSRFGPEEVLYDRVIRGREVLSTLRARDRKALDAQGILAAPLCSTRTRETFGMLKIEHMVPLQVIPVAERCLVALCKHIALVFDRSDQSRAAAATEHASLSALSIEKH